MATNLGRATIARNAPPRDGSSVSVPGTETAARPVRALRNLFWVRLAVVLVVAASPGALFAQIESVRNLAHSQLSVIALASGYPPSPVGRLLVADVRVASLPKLRLFRVWQDLVSEYDQVLVGAIGDTIFPLGGFSCPDVRAVAAAWEGTGDQDLIELSQTLALALDPNGAEQVVFPFVDAKSGIALAWRRAVSTTWDRDSSWHNASSFVVRTTVLSQLHRDGKAWTPYVYVFAYNTTGQILAWWRNAPGIDFSEPH